MNSGKLYIATKIMGTIPETRAFGFKRSLLRWAGAKVGKNVRICSSARFMGAGELTIGDNTWIGPEVFISAAQSVIIGCNCDIAPRVYIGDGTHEITPDKERVADTECCRPVAIGHGCWLCANATVLAGVSIAPKTVIAAGAVVTRSCDELKTMIAGIPAKITKRL